LAVIEGTIAGVKVGDRHPVRIMAVINLSRESFYQRSVAGPDDALALAASMQEQGADLIDLGAVSTAPGSPPIDLSQERERLLPALKEIVDQLQIPVSVDTQRARIAEEALTLGAACINDVSGLCDPEMSRTVADHDASLVIMASRLRPGDLLLMEEIITVLGDRMRSAENAGVDAGKISLDPGVGRWVPEKTPEYDLAILDGFDRLRVLNRPLMAAVSRKSFIGARLGQLDPAQRLCGSLAATAIAVYNGAHIARTHDVSASLEAARLAQAIRGKRPRIDGEMPVEALAWLGIGQDLQEIFRQTGVDPGGWDILSKKGSFRVLLVGNLSSMEAIIIKQEMLARGGDAAIPKMALRCDPQPEEVLIMGTVSQIEGLAKNLKNQPFRLAQVGKAIEAALEELDNPERYR
jgi:dihydropteroate synthase